MLDFATFFVHLIPIMIGFEVLKKAKKKKVTKSLANDISPFSKTNVVCSSLAAPSVQD